MPLPKGHKKIRPIERRKIRKPIIFSKTEKEKVQRKIDRYERIAEKLTEKKHKMTKKYGSNSEEAQIADLNLTKVNAELDKLDFSASHMDLLIIEKKLKTSKRNKLLDRRDDLLNQLEETSKSYKRRKAKLARGLNKTKKS